MYQNLLFLNDADIEILYRLTVSDIFYHISSPYIYKAWSLLNSCCVSKTQWHMLDKWLTDNCQTVNYQAMNQKIKDIKLCKCDNFKFILTCLN